MKFTPKHSFADAANLLVEGLEDGSIMLGRGQGEAMPEEPAPNLRRCAAPEALPTLTAQTKPTSTGRAGYDSAAPTKRIQAEKADASKQ